MKATGIVRRIDELGRVVIPKEIRRTMRIREGDPLEIFTEAEGTVVFKKYSPAGQLWPMSAQICDAVSRTSGRCAAVMDREEIICASGPGKKELEGRRISRDAAREMETRREFSGAGVTDEGGMRAAVGSPIIAQGDLYGAVVLMENGVPPSDGDRLLCRTAAMFLSRQLEA